MKIGLATPAVPARKQFPMESFASECMRKQQNLTVKKKNIIRFINSTSIQIMLLKTVKSIQEEAGWQHCVWAIFVIEEKHTFLDCNNSSVSRSKTRLNKLFQSFSSTITFPFSFSSKTLSLSSIQSSLWSFSWQSASWLFRNSIWELSSMTWKYG